jgi:hypothetical protein
MVAENACQRRQRRFVEGVQQALSEAVALGSTSPAEATARLMRTRARLEALEAQSSLFTSHKELQTLETEVANTEQQAAEAETNASALAREIRRLRVVELRRTEAAAEVAQLTTATTGVGPRRLQPTPVAVELQQRPRTSQAATVSAASARESLSLDRESPTEGASADRSGRHSRVSFSSAAGGVGRRFARLSSPSLPDLLAGVRAQRASDVAGAPWPGSQPWVARRRSSGGLAPKDQANSPLERRHTPSSSRSATPAGATATSTMPMSAAVRASVTPTLAAGRRSTAAGLSVDARASKLLATISSFESLFNRGSYREAARLATLPGNEVLRTPTTWERFSDPTLDRAGAWKTYAEALLRARATDVEQAQCLRAALERGAIELLLHWFAMRKVRHSRSAARALLERYSSTPPVLQSRVSSIGLAVCAEVAARDNIGALWEEAFFRAAMGQPRPALAYVTMASVRNDLEMLAEAAAGAIVSTGAGSFFCDSM